MPPRTPRAVRKVIPALSPTSLVIPLPTDLPETIGRFHGAYRFLSNFFPSPVVYAGETYPTAEHAFQAAKTLDKKWRARIQGAAVPGNAKALGRAAPLREDWEAVKIAVMFGVLFHKFLAHTLLIDRLAATDPAYLEEGNTWHDNFWGVCYCADCPGLGKNILGKLLMRLRDQLPLVKE